MRKFVAIAFMLFITVAIPTMAQQWDTRQCGAGPANWVKNEISSLTSSDPNATSKFEVISDLYWSDPQNRWCSPTGAKNTGWGVDKGLMYFPLYSYAMVAYELRKSVEFTPIQINKLDDVLTDAAQRLVDGTYYYYGPCGVFRTPANRDDGCGEDDGSIVAFIAIVRNLYPEVAEKFGEYNTTESFEKKFFEKTHSTDYDNGGDLVVANGVVTLPNHGGASTVYSLYDLTSMGRAALSYKLAGKTLPEWYRNDNMLALFHWAQEHALPDGSAFTNDCVRNNGQVVACNDPGISDGLPEQFPGGRIIQELWGDEVFTPGQYKFLDCNKNLLGVGNYDIDRFNHTCVWNPGLVDLSMVASASQPDYVDVRWLTDKGANVLALNLASQAKYDVWGPTGRVAEDLSETAYTFNDVQCGTVMNFSVMAKGADGRIAGWDRGTAQLDCGKRVIRRHLSGGVTGGPKH